MKRRLTCVLALLGGCATVDPAPTSRIVERSLVDEMPISGAIQQALEGTAKATEPGAEPPKSLGNTQVAPGHEKTAVAFPDGSSELDDEAGRIIGELVPSLQAADQVMVRGYGDKGKDPKALSLKRATVVRDALIKAGVPAKKIRIFFSVKEPYNQAVIELAKKKP